MKDIIAQLRTQGLTDAQIIAALDNAKLELDLISAPELLKKLRKIKPGYTKHALYKLAKRHPDAHATKSGGIWYFSRSWADAWLAKVRSRPSITSEK